MTSSTPSFVTPDLIRGPLRQRSNGPRIKSNEPRVSLEGDDCSKRSEEHTSELQSIMRISSAVVCLKQKKTSPPHLLMREDRTGVNTNDITTGSNPTHTTNIQRTV